MADQASFKCAFCGGAHPFVPHPTKPGRVVAYCAGREVCEANEQKPRRATRRKKPKGDESGGEGEDA
jgi:hypothetical protein